MSDLKRFNLLHGGGNLITFTGAYSGLKMSVFVRVVRRQTPSYVALSYAFTDSDFSAKEEMNYEIEFTTTPCKYGGERLWFLCPMRKNWAPCRRRVGTLYRYGKYFMCRHCCELTYDSQLLSGRHKGRGRIISFPEINDFEARAKRTHYRGRPTRKYRRYLEMERRFWVSFGASVQRIQEMN